MPIQRVDAVIVGAGFGGLYAIYRLREMGFSIQAFEAGEDVGGTWYWNRYPGARCDVESIDYSYSFSSELQEEWQWSMRYAPQPEILRYINHAADRFHLREHIKFNTRVNAALFDEAEQRWTVTTDQGDTVSAQFCVMATGCLSAAKTPEVDGLESFGGRWYHTGRWPHEEVNFTGQRVAVIGTGSSGIQIIPVLAEQAGHLFVFQRTPNFTMPAKNAPLDPEYVREVKARYAERREISRQSLGGMPLVIPPSGALDVEPEERDEIFRKGWNSGAIAGFLFAFNDLLVNPESNAEAAEFHRRQIHEIVHDPKVADLLAPTDYPIGTKRPCLDTNYYATFNRSNVTLVDVRSSPIQEFTKSGIRTADETYEVDSIVFATGYDAMTGALTRIDLRGRGGESLKSKWSQGPSTYLGIATAGFPNLFIITGPGSPSVFSNMTMAVEQHIDWVSDCMDFLRRAGYTSIEASLEAECKWVEHVTDVANATLYPRANSWYVGANVPGKPRVFMPYVGGVGVYRQKCDEVAEHQYEGFVLSK